MQDEYLLSPTFDISTGGYEVSRKSDGLDYFWTMNKLNYIDAMNACHRRPGFQLAMPLSQASYGIIRNVAMTHGDDSLQDL